MNIWLSGYNGRMGQEIADLLSNDPETEVTGGSGLHYLKNNFQEKKNYTPLELSENLAQTELIIDFSSPEGNEALYQASLSLRVPKAFLIGTTGLNKHQRDRWKQICKESNHKLLFAPNTSLGILLTMQLSQQLAKALQPNGFDIEIVESHHKHKADSPSGTAKFLARGICDVVPLEMVTHRTGKRQDSELGVVALRGGSVFGEHTVKFLGEDEELVVSHRALSRSLFAKGAIILGRWLLKQDNGTHYHLSNVTF